MALEPQEHRSFFGKAANVVLIVLVLIALVMAYFLYQRLAGDVMPPVPPPDRIQDGTPQNPETRNDTTGSFDFKPLSADERAALNPPDGPDATEGERQAHFDLVARTAVPSEELSIGPNCAVSPAVLRTKQGGEIQLRNYDTVPHLIVFNETSSFSVPAKKSISIPVTFGADSGATGVFGYGCDMSNGGGAVGMWFVTQ